MKIPKIHGRNKIRDTKICRLWSQDLVDIQDLAVKFNLSVSRIYRLLYDNREFLRLDNNWEKEKRIVWLKKQIKTKKVTKKDPADLLEQLRKEIEGDKPLVDNSTHITKVTYEWYDPNKESEDPIRASRLPERQPL